MDVVTIVILLMTALNCLAVRKSDALTKNQVSKEESLKWTPREKLVDALKARKIQSAATVTGFTWESCDDHSVIQVTELKLSPDPLRLPGTVTFSIALGISEVIFGDDITANLTVLKKVKGKYEMVPCRHHVGSCTYKDLCRQLQPLARVCPTVLKKQGLHCVCPFPANKYSVSKTSVRVAKMVPDGDYKVSVRVVQGETIILCFKSHVQIE